MTPPRPQDLVHVGLPKTGTTALQTHFWPWLAGQDENLVYVGKMPIPDTVGSVFENNGFTTLREGLDRRSDAFDPVIDRSLTDIYQKAIKPIESAGRRFILSDEIITGLKDFEQFTRNMTMFNRIGFEGRYLLFLRDIPDLLESLTPTLLMLERNSGRLHYLVDGDGKLDGRTALTVVGRWYEKQGAKARHGKACVFSTVLDYAGIIRALGPERTSVIRYSGDFSENAGFHAFIEDTYGVDIPADLLSQRANTAAGSWSEIIADADQISRLKGEVKTLLDRVERKIIDRHPECQASRRLFARLDPDRPALGSDLLAG